MSGCVEGWARPHPAPPARHDRDALCVFPGRCWALNENMAYWWIIRIPILLASLVGGPQRPPEPFPGAGAGSRLGFGDGGREGWPRGGTGPWVPPLPPLSPPQINLLIFMRILKVILAKLRANQKGYADYKLR